MTVEEKERYAEIMELLRFRWPDATIGHAQVVSNFITSSLVKENARLREALSDVFGLIESGYLCRDISRDHEPDFALRQIEPMQKLAKARAALEQKS